MNGNAKEGDDGPSFRLDTIRGRTTALHRREGSRQRRVRPVQTTRGFSQSRTPGREKEVRGEICRYGAGHLSLVDRRRTGVDPLARLVPPFPLPRQAASVRGSVRRVWTPGTGLVPPDRTARKSLVSERCLSPCLAVRDLSRRTTSASERVVDPHSGSERAVHNTPLSKQDPCQLYRRSSDRCEPTNGSSEYLTGRFWSGTIEVSVVAGYRSTLPTPCHWRTR